MFGLTKESDRETQGQEITGGETCTTVSVIIGTTRHTLSERLNSDQENQNPVNHNSLDLFFPR
jgi:hypothetical protein